ncbi:MAG: hypothetical protein MUO77_15930 [Anaerolineales bacterium]|nr:hypothetical protein [Anaerolineales bacterium]
MSLELSTVFLVFLLTVILAVYNQRQASALRGVERLVQDFVAMQFRSIRRAYAGSFDTLNPFEWVSNQVSAGLPQPVTVSEVVRVVPEVEAVEFRTGDQRRVVVSTRSWLELYYFDRKARHIKKGGNAADRVSNFASRPLLNRSRFGWGITTVEGVTSNTAEFFDLEADMIGKKLGVSWNNPTRLFFHVVE